MKDKKNKNINGEINSLFEKLLKSRKENLKNIEDLKKRLTTKLDIEIKRLHARRDMVRQMWERREELRLKRIGVLKKLLRNSLAWNLRYIISMPFIYMMFIPSIILHIFLEAYHQICFRLYGIERVNPREYFIFDRRLLPYLNWLEKFNCFFCSYFNCLISYTREIAGRTEKYWCPIKHSKYMKDPHNHYATFVDYDDGEALRAKWDALKNIE